MVYNTLYHRPVKYTDCLPYLELQVFGDLRSQQTEQIGGAGELVAGHYLLSDGSTSHQMTPLQDAGLKALGLQVGGTHQPVVT